MAERTCNGCGTSYRPTVGQQRYCTIACRKQASNKRWNTHHSPLDTDSSTPCSEDGCERVRAGRGLCKMHYKRLMRSLGHRSPSDQWTEKRQDNYHRRRARSRNGDTALLSDIIERDGLICPWCQLTVDLSLSWPDPMSKSIDHVTPIALQGRHTLDNTQLMHLRCNMIKGSRAPRGSTPPRPVLQDLRG